MSDVDLALLMVVTFFVPKYTTFFVLVVENPVPLIVAGDPTLRVLEVMEVMVGPSSVPPLQMTVIVAVESDATALDGLLVTLIGAVIVA